MKFINKNNEEIPADVWFKTILPIMQEGYQLKICPAGRSMVPFLRGGRDEAVLSVPDGRRDFRKNDIVLYRVETGVFVLHRVYKINKNGIYTMGDGNTGVEGPFQREDVLAVADYIIRKGKKILNDDRRYITLVNLWRFSRPFRPFVIRGYAVFNRLIRQIRKR